MAKLSQRQIEEYLAEARIAHLVTIRPSGGPHVAPVWFDWTGGGSMGRATVMAGEGGVKVRNLGKDPRVALSVAAEGRPYSYVVMEGEARLTKDGLAEVVERICVRYDGPERGLEFAQGLLDRGGMILLDIRVDRVTSWVDDDG
jgi:PPOX class probable F420-dependent enzyme